MIYEIEYKYLDEMEDKHSRWREGLVCVLDTKTVRDNLIREFLREENIDQADKLLTKAYGLKDEDIAFYCEKGEYGEEVMLAAGLQKDFDIIINNMKCVE